MIIFSKVFGETLFLLPIIIVRLFDKVHKIECKHRNAEGPDNSFSKDFLFLVSVKLRKKTRLNLFEVMPFAIGLFILSTNGSAIIVQLYVAL